MHEVSVVDMFHAAHSLDAATAAEEQGMREEVGTK
jgi:hypothetical protein